MNSARHSRRSTSAVAAAALVAIVATTAGCSVMEGAGRWTRESGESMEAYGQRNEGVWGSIVGFTGRVNKAVGGTVESIARGDGDEGVANESADTTATAQRDAAPAATPVATAPAVAPVASVQPAPVVAAAAPSAPSAQLTARAQARLAELGYDVGKADGIIGPRTRAALQAYQRKQGLDVTGALDQPTLAALGLAAQTASRAGRGA